MSKLKSLLFLLAIGFISCENESAVTDDLNQIETSLVAYELVFESAESVVDDIVLYSESTFGAGITSKGFDKRGRSKFFKECATISLEEVDGVKTTTIVFDEGCEDRHGNVITGTIIKVRTISDDSKERAVTFEDFSINGFVINGTKNFVFTASNEDGFPEMNGSVNMSVETEDGTKTKVGTRTIVITAGGDTDTCYDDEKTITGSSEYTNEEGNVLTVTITTPLVKPAACRYIASGIKEYTSEAGTAVVDYGDGTCDNVATKTAIDGTVTEIELRKKKR